MTVTGRRVRSTQAAEGLTSWSLKDVFLVSKEVGRVGSALGPGLPLAWTLSLHPGQEVAGLLSGSWFLPLLPLLLYSTRKPEWDARLLPSPPPPAPGTGM